MSRSEECRITLSKLFGPLSRGFVRDLEFVASCAQFHSQDYRGSQAGGQICKEQPILRILQNTEW